MTLVTNVFTHAYCLLFRISILIKRKLLTSDEFYTFATLSGPAAGHEMAEGVPRNMGI